MNLKLFLLIFLLLICLSNQEIARPAGVIRLKRSGGSGRCCRSRMRSGSQMNPLTLILGAKAVALKAILIKQLIASKMSTPAPMMMVMANGTMAPVMMMGRR